MILDEAVERYIAIPEERKAHFLVRLSYELTAYMRGCYVDDPDPGLRATKIKGANEIQHQLASEAGQHLAENLKRYPDDALIRICVEQAEMYQIGGEFAGAFKRALDRFDPRQQLL